MPIEHHKHGGTCLTGDSIDFFRLCALRGAVGLEIKGIKVRRGPVVWRQVKREFNLAGGRESVYAWLDAEVARLRPLQEHVDEHGRRTVAGEDVQ